MSEIYGRALAALRSAGVDVDAPFVDAANALAGVPDRVRDVSLAALFGAKAARDFRAFWFPQREIATGAALGFPNALLVVDPLPLVHDALDRVDAAYAQLHASLSCDVGADGRKLDARAYADLFDPAFVSFVNVDDQRIDAALDDTAAAAL